MPTLCTLYHNRVVQRAPHQSAAGGSEGDLLQASTAGTVGGQRGVMQGGCWRQIWCRVGVQESLNSALLLHPCVLASHTCVPNHQCCHIPRQQTDLGRSQYVIPHSIFCFWPPTAPFLCLTLTLSFNTLTFFQNILQVDSGRCRILPDGSRWLIDLWGQAADLALTSKPYTVRSSKGSGPRKSSRGGFKWLIPLVAYGQVRCCDGVDRGLLMSLYGWGA